MSEKTIYFNELVKKCLFRIDIPQEVFAILFSTGTILKQICSSIFVHSYSRYLSQVFHINILKVFFLK